MNEYLKILNDSGSVIIDDTYRNFHFIKKVVRQRTVTDTIPSGHPFFNAREPSIKCHRFIVESVEQPIVAFDNLPVLHMLYEEISTNTWEISVFFTDEYAAYGYTIVNSFPQASVNYYVFGLLPLVDTNQRPAFIVRNAANEIVFSSTHGPMVIVDVYSKDVSDLISFDQWVWKEHIIPNYDPNRKYAVAICGGSSFSISPEVALSYVYQSYSVRKTVSTTNPALTDRFLIGLVISTSGYTSNYFYEDPIHTQMILDVTGL